MGESSNEPQQQIEITFAPGAGEALAQVIVGTIEAYASARITPPPPVIQQNGPDVEPWAFYSPTAKCDVVAYLDDHNQVRHVPTTRTTDVPRHWRRLYVDRA